MPSPKQTFGDKHQERLSNAADAKKAALEKFRAQAEAANSPEAIARREEKAKIAEERDARQATAKAAKEAQAAADKAAREEEARLAAEAAEAEKQAKKEREAALVAEQKAARDARYAARKGRKN